MLKVKAKFSSINKLNYPTDLSTRMQDVCLLYIYPIPSTVLSYTRLIAKHGLTSRHNLIYNLKFETSPKDFRHGLSFRNETKKVLNIKHKIFNTQDKEDAKYETQQKIK